MARIKFLTPTSTLFSISLSVLLLILAIASCTSNEIGKSKDVNPESIYFDYKVTGEEGKADATLMMQYRFGGPNGTTLVLDEPASVEFDGTIVPVDSSRFGGAYYEVVMPLQKFSGNHSIVFTDLDLKKYSEEFSFQPFRLKTTLPETMNRKDLSFELEGLNPTDYIRIVMTDTSFASKDINRVDTVKNGRLTISKEDLNKLVNGPIYLEFYKEESRPLSSTTREGGNISKSYFLKRDFILKD